jgi:glucokinase
MTGAEQVTLAAAKRPLFIGIDVGGTSVKLGVVDDAGRSLGKTSVLTQEDHGPAAAFERSLAAMQELLKSLQLSLEDIAAIGLGTPGPQDIKLGIIIGPDNLPHWKNFPAVEFIRSRTNKPVAFANDANAAAFGECWVGSGRHHHSVVMFTLGTGVGGGIIIGDFLIEGDHSHGGELGHLIIDCRDDALNINGKGHLETFASATGVIGRVKLALNAGEPTSIRTRVAEGEAISPLMVMQEAEKGDAYSHRLIMETAYYLAIGIVTMMHTIDPGIVVIGGAMTFGGHDHPLGREFLEKIRAVVKQRAYPIPAAKCVIDYAQLGSDAGYIGAAGIARTAYHKK